MHLVAIKIQFKYVGIVVERQEKSGIEGLKQFRILLNGSLFNLC